MYSQLVQVLVVAQPSLVPFVVNLAGRYLPSPPGLAVCPYKAVHLQFIHV